MSSCIILIRKGVKKVHSPQFLLLTLTLRLTQIAHKTAGWDKEKGFYQENMRQDPLNIDAQYLKKGSFCFGKFNCKRGVTQKKGTGGKKRSAFTITLPAVKIG
jgi:hypothetical protein